MVPFVSLRAEPFTLISKDGLVGVMDTKKSINQVPYCNILPCHKLCDAVVCNLWWVVVVGVLWCLLAWDVPYYEVFGYVDGHAQKRYNLGWVIGWAV